VFSRTSYASSGGLVDVNSRLNIQPSGSAGADDLAAAARIIEIPPALGGNSATARLRRAPPNSMCFELERRQ